MRISVLGLVAALLIGAIAAPADAGVIRIGPGGFTPEATVITFSEQSLGTLNPHYSLATTSLGTVDVDFEGHFVGQADDGLFPNSLSDTTPTNPLTLDSGAPDTWIQSDGSNPTSPVLTGGPNVFNGPIAVIFSKAVGAVGLDGGYFDAPQSTTIEAYAADGTSLGSVTNNGTGIEFFGLRDSSGANVIKGISFYITGSEPAGFAIDNLTFGTIREVTGAVPLPSAAWLGLTMLGGLFLVRRRRKA